MLTIDTDTIFDYLSCPLKLSFDKKDREFNSYQNIKCYIYNHLFDYCLLLKIGKQLVSLPKLNDKLNSIWASMKDKISCKTNLSLKLSIKNKLSYFIDLFANTTKVVYFNIPRNISIGNYNILYHFYSMYHKSELKTIVKIGNQFINMGENSYALGIVGGAIHRSLKGLGDDLRHNLYFFRSDTGDLLKPSYNKEYKMCIENLIRGIESKIYYPRNEFMVCNSCQYNKSCSWSSNK